LDIPTGIKKVTSNYNKYILQEKFFTDNPVKKKKNGKKYCKINRVEKHN